MWRLLSVVVVGMILCLTPVVLHGNTGYWGFYGHRLINRMAVFRLPQEMFPFFRKYIYSITIEAVGPDQRRHVVQDEAPMHYLDMDAYDAEVLRRWQKNPAYFDSIPHAYWHAHGALPHRVYRYAENLTYAFMEKNGTSILRLSADLGHYIADAHVPLHTTENYDGQLTGQEGIHGLWESRLPELFSSTYDLSGEKARYIQNLPGMVWQILNDSHSAVDSVLMMEKAESMRRKGNITAFDTRNKVVSRQYSREFAQAYHRKLNDMVERRLRASIRSTADVWYTCWVNAGQPDLSELVVSIPEEQAPAKRVRHSRNAVHK